MMDLTWMDTILRKAPIPTIFLTEGVFPYFQSRDVRKLVLALSDYFPGSEIVFDGLSSLSLSMHQLTTPVLKATGTRLQWAINNGRELESWGEGIHLLDEWFYYKNHEPRMHWFNLMRYFPLLGKENPGAALPAWGCGVTAESHLRGISVDSMQTSRRVYICG